MNNNRRTVLASALAASITAAVPLSAFAQKKIVVGFSQIGAESEWRTANTNSMKSAAAAAGIELKFSDAQQKQENQIKALRSFIAQKVDVIALTPVVESGWDTVLKEIKDAKIPLILMDRSVDSKDTSLYATHIGFDFVKQGEMAGQWLADRAKTMKGDINVVELQGTVGSSPAINRKQGFEEALEGHANLSLIRSQTGDFTRSKGKEVMEGFLKAEDGGKNICAVYAHNDDMAVGAIQAIKDAGLKPGTDIKVLSIDAVPDIFAAMVTGEANATVELTPNMAGPAFEALDAYLSAGTMPEKFIITESKLYTPADDPQGEYDRRKGLGY